MTNFKNLLDSMTPEKAADIIVELDCDLCPVYAAYKKAGKLNDIRCGDIECDCYSTALEWLNQDAND